VSDALRDIVVTLAAAHINVDEAGREGVRKMAFDVLREACSNARAQGARPITVVDDLSMHAVGDWVDDFAAGLTEAALLEGVSITGGEMAQMGDTYAAGWISVVVYVAAIKE